MQWTSIIVIYPLFWVMSAFFVLPFGVRTHDEAGVAKIPGQADSAPVRFEPRKIVRRSTVVSLILSGLYYANYVNGWITTDDINIVGKLAGV